uniref:NADH-ubiquinone oxidoreductase chain 4 n=1 Tax=Xiphydria sp. ZJUH 2008002 TaxID=2488325 RepID=A0A3G5BC92_9HYME|nr:NADH dehydrogenase subunit 4 [Euxiphydria potanini]AYV97251.1 NADH deshydrogenase subunit 4 [Xiphydria sp. ZJUH 2008002]UYW35403.1 NADH dehydrogenase subunit 4 [Euxiphydria potanini]
MMMLFFMLMFLLMLLNFLNKMKLIFLIQNLFFYMSLIIFLLLLNLNLYFYLSGYLGLDIYSFWLILLSFWIFGLMIMASNMIFLEENYFMKYLFLMLIMLLLFLILTFSMMNLFMFYLFFESTLIPILILILGWGNQSERFQASMYLIIYTLMASLPFLFILIYILKKKSSLNFIFLMMMNFVKMKLGLKFIFYFFMIFLFLMKMPMFFIHLWLPKAHVEAPIFGSMVLAGILLKMGGYGLLRFLYFVDLYNFLFNNLFISFSLMGGVVISLISMNQIDLKMLVAYSSVVHMSLVMSGSLTLMNWGFMGSLILMISHGLCSSGLFVLVNFVYERISSRSLIINKGFLNLMPSMGLWWFLMCSCNMAVPPSLNLLSEIILINSLVMWNMHLIIILMMMSFFSALYTLYLYSFNQYGSFYSGIYSFFNGFNREYLLMILHWLPLNFLMVKIELFY